MKSPIPLNRYDDFLDENSTVSTPQRDRTPEPKIVARGLYNFVAQNNRYQFLRLLKTLGADGCVMHLQGTVVPERRRHLRPSSNRQELVRRGTQRHDWYLPRQLRRGT